MSYTKKKMSTAHILLLKMMCNVYLCNLWGSFVFECTRAPLVWKKIKKINIYVHLKALLFLKVSIPF
jgi:hypothetical protein